MDRCRVLHDVLRQFGPVGREVHHDLQPDRPTAGLSESLGVLRILRAVQHHLHGASVPEQADVVVPEQLYVPVAVIVGDLGYRLHYPGYLGLPAPSL